MQGLSEPVGALIALLFIKPFLTPLLLQYMLAFVGGIMVRACAALDPPFMTLCAPRLSMACDVPGHV